MKTTKFEQCLKGLMAFGLIMMITLAAGCGPSDKVDPDARVPDVPPSTRGARGAIPGEAGDFKKKKTSYIIEQHSRAQVG